MESGTVFTILGILATIFFGGLGVYFTIKRKYPGQITFLKESSLPLFDSIVKNMPELEVLYEKKPVTERLVLLKGVFLNTGTKDINEPMVEEKICVNVPEGFQWLAGKVVSTSPNVQASVEIEPRKLILTHGLFRCKEFIRFEALAEIPVRKKEDSVNNINVDKKLADSIEITHRIADTQKVKNRELPDTSKTTKRMRIVSGLIVATILVVVSIAGIIFFKGWPSQITYLLNKDGTNIEVSIKPQSDGTVKVSQVNGDFEEIIPVDDFFVNQNLKPTIVPDKSHKNVMIFFGISYLSIPLVLLLIIYAEHRKATKVRRMISEVKIN